MNKRLLISGLLFISMSSLADLELLIAHRDIVVTENTTHTKILSSDKGIHCNLVTRPSNFEKKAEKGSQFVVVNTPSIQPVQFNKEAIIELVVSELRALGVAVREQDIAAMKKQTTVKDLEKYLESKGVAMSGQSNQMILKLKSLKTQSRLTVSCVSSSVFTYDDLLVELLEAGDLKPSTDL